MPYLFSYGSNNLPQLKSRLGINNPKLYPAYLPKYSLIFGFNSHIWKGAVASFVSDKNSNLLGNIIYCTLDDLLTLDKFEGIKHHHYKRIKKKAIYYQAFIQVGVIKFS